MSDVKIFGAKCAEMGVQEAAVVAVADDQALLDTADLADWSSELRIGMTLFDNWESIVDQALAKRSQIANYAAVNRFSAINYCLGVPAVIASAAVGTAVFGSLNENLEVWARILVGVTSFAAAVLTSLQTFLKFDERASKHRSAAAEYGTHPASTAPRSPRFPLR